MKRYEVFQDILGEIPEGNTITLNGRGQDLIVIERKEDDLFSFRLNKVEERELFYEDMVKWLLIYESKRGLLKIKIKKKSESWKF